MSLFLHLLVGPELRYISFSIPSSDNPDDQASLATFKSVLAALRSTCPLLESIAVSSAWRGQSAESTSLLSSYLASYRNLKCIKCPDIELVVQDVAKLSSLPSLETMVIRFSSSGDVESGSNISQITRTCLHTPASTFPSLKHLEVRSCDVRCYPQLASIMLPVIETLEVELETTGQSRLSQPLFALIASQCASESLSALYLLDCRDDGDLVTCPNIAISSSHLRHLLIFRNLRRLEIAAIPWSTEYDDGVLIDAATAWPDLEYLDVNTSVRVSGWRRSSSYATLRSVYAFAKNYGRINHLGVLLDAQEPSQYTELLPNQDEWHDDGSLHTLPNLAVLDLAWSTIDDPERVAMMLSYFLPEDVRFKLGTNGVYVADPEEMEAVEMERFIPLWERVMVLFPPICRVRTQERARARRLIASGNIGAV
ncbi:uncharacterized protein B0H18DRAFT_950713 [Fomitopsis serialis]|uniref:uncharacterized protein n=1 Tax=Fomitopsis serialis TaxID=139415 RepID=UPI0020075A61|nr:uncharacterized protein B0H18DRAFT_950713 [Neoantrodia serialis]KAH9936430.1 hypothetical protein B0H18DRAFT_950713 [Neoantrodia serialis]